MEGISQIRILVVLMLLAPGTGPAQTKSDIGAVGFITDTQCGKKGATAQHIDCTKRSVAEIFTNDTDQVGVQESA